MRVVTTDSESDFEAAMACTRNRKISPSTTAICLELARRQNLPLATLDFALDQAAVAEGPLLAK